MKYNVYEILDTEMEDDQGKKSKLQFQSGPYPDKDTAWKEASRLNHQYQGYYNFTAKVETRA